MVGTSKLKSSFLSSQGALLSALVIAASLISTGCTKKRSDRGSSDPHSIVYKDLVVPLRKVPQVPQVPVDIVELARKISQEEPIRFVQITDRIVKEHVAQYRKMESGSPWGPILTGSQVNHRLIQLSESIRNSQNFFDSKPLYEKEIRRLSLASEIPYSRVGITLVHPLSDGKIQGVQAYSGTLLNLILHRRKYLASDYLKQNFVVIVTSGHVLPGQMIPTKDGGWQLFGVETTAKEAGVVNLGDTRSIGTSIHIYHADLFALSEVFKRYLDPQQQYSFAYRLRQITASLYGLPLEPQSSYLTQQKTEALGGFAMAGFSRVLGEGAVATRLDQSPLVFGVTQTPYGVESRELNVGKTSPAWFKISNQGELTTMAQMEVSVAPSEGVESLPDASLSPVARVKKRIEQLSGPIPTPHNFKNVLCMKKSVVVERLLDVSPDFEDKWVKFFGFANALTQRELGLQFVPYYELLQSGGRVPGLVFLWMGENGRARVKTSRCHPLAPIGVDNPLWKDCRPNSVEELSADLYQLSSKGVVHQAGDPIQAEASFLLRAQKNGPSPSFWVTFEFDANKENLFPVTAEILPLVEDPVFSGAVQSGPLLCMPTNGAKHPLVAVE